MSNNITNVDKNLCTGCSACKAICPKDAIFMQPNSEGFLYPSINYGNCIDCGICSKICPAINKDEYENRNDPDCYAMWADDETRIKSSSGGMFTVIANKIINDGGVVFGAAWNSKWSVELVSVDNKEELYKLRGSKYVQSSTANTYKEAKDALKEGKKVFYVGCACQIAGLKHFLNKEYDNLLTADILCHGSPSPLAFDKFLYTELKGFMPNPEMATLNDIKSQISEISFRDKNRHGWGHSIYIKMNNGMEYDKLRSETPWYSSFLNNLNCRSACGNCRYASIPRQGDITLGDFWGIENCLPDMADGKGTSVILINTKKGQSVLDEIHNNIQRLEPAQIADAQKQNWNLVGSSKSHKERKRFFELLNMNDDYGKITEYALKRKFDIGYIGWWYGENYGSVLTNFALNRYLVSKKLSVLMIEWPLKRHEQYPVPNSFSRRLANKYYDISMRRTYSELPDLNWFCDAFVVGSDQLWNYWSTKENGAFFFLDFVEDSKKKIAYSTSFGHPTYGAPSYILKENAFHMDRLDYISVRENDGVDICKSVFGVDAIRTMDPVFLCDKKEYLNLIVKSNRKIEEPYIFAYILSPSDEKRIMLIELREKLGLRIVLVLDAQAKDDSNKKAMNMDDYLCENLEIEDWLYYLKNSEYVVTDSYHAVCFSIIFEKQFACIANIKRGLSRFMTILSLLGITNRMIFDATETFSVLKNGSIKYDKVNLKLNSEIRKSKIWLDDALSANKPKKSSAYDILLNKIRALEKEVNDLKKQSQ